VSVGACMYVWVCEGVYGYVCQYVGVRMGGWVCESVHAWLCGVRAHLLCPYVWVDLCVKVFVCVLLGVRVTLYSSMYVGVGA
jgi:hypothetical protein